jgi:biotin transport system substrate-specific component
VNHAAAAAAQPRVLADVVPYVRARDVALVVAGALLTALCAQIAIPVPGDPVPITGQTFAVLLCGASLGANRGAAALALYAGLGFIGLPFYSDGGSGPEVIFGTNGGYILGFIVSAYVVGALAERKHDRRPATALPLFALGTLIIYACGVPWLAVSADLSLAQAIQLGVVPFIPGAIVKALAAAGLLPATWKFVNRQSGDSR